MTHNAEHFYEYEGGVIVCGTCLDSDLEMTRSGAYVGDERVYQGMFKRLTDDAVEPYQCDQCLKQNEAYDQLGEEE